MAHWPSQIVWWMLLKRRYLVIVNLYWSQRASIRIRKSLSNEMRTKRGVRHGCGLSPCLFNRRMLEISWTEKVTNKDVWSRMKLQKRLFTTSQIRKLKYFVHMNRHSSMHTTLLNDRVNGKRGRGRLRPSWISNIKERTMKSYIEAFSFDKQQIWLEDQCPQPSARWRDLMMIMMIMTPNLRTLGGCDVTLRVMYTWTFRDVTAFVLHSLHSNHFTAYSVCDRGSAESDFAV